MSEQQKDKKNRLVFLWILIIFLLITNGITGWLLFTEKIKL